MTPWVCKICGEEQTRLSLMQHKCSPEIVAREKIIANESERFDRLWPEFLESDLGKFLTFYARKLINGSAYRSDNTLA